MDVIDVLTLIAPYALLIISFVSLFGNGTILLVVIKNASLRQKDCLYLIAALAVADFLTGELFFGCDLRGKCGKSVIRLTH